MDFILCHGSRTPNHFAECQVTNLFSHHADWIVLVFNCGLYAGIKVFLFTFLHAEILKTVIALNYSC